MSLRVPIKLGDTTYLIHQVVGDYINKLEKDCEDFREAAKIALKDRDKQVIKVKQLEEERRMYLDEKATFKEQIKQLEDGIRRIKKWVVSKSNTYDMKMAIEQECEFFLDKAMANYWI